MTQTNFVKSLTCMNVWVVCVAVQLLDANLGNGTGRRTVTMVAPLLFASGAGRYEEVLHNWGASPIGGIDL